MVASDFAVLHPPTKKNNNKDSSYQRLDSSPSSPPPSSPPSIAAASEPRPPLTPPPRLQDRKLLPSLLLRPDSSASSTIPGNSDRGHMWDPAMASGNLRPMAKPIEGPYVPFTQLSLSNTLFSGGGGGTSRQTSSPKPGEVIPMTSTNSKSIVPPSSTSSTCLVGSSRFPSSPICAPTFNKLEPRLERMLQSSHYSTDGSSIMSPPQSAVGGRRSASAESPSIPSTRLRSPPPVTFTFPMRTSADPNHHQHARCASSSSALSSLSSTAAMTSPASAGTTTTFGATVLGTYNRNRAPFQAHHRPSLSNVSTGSNGYTMATITRRMEDKGGRSGGDRSRTRHANPFLEGDESDGSPSSPPPSSSSSSSTTSSIILATSPNQSSFVAPSHSRRPPPPPPPPYDDVSPGISDRAVRPDLPGRDSSSSLVTSLLMVRKASVSPPPLSALPKVPFPTGSMIGLAKTTAAMDTTTSRTPSLGSSYFCAPPPPSTPAAALSTGEARGGPSPVPVSGVNLGRVMGGGSSPSAGTLSLHTLAKHHRRPHHHRHQQRQDEGTMRRDSWGSWGDEEGEEEEEGRQRAFSLGSGGERLSASPPPPKLMGSGTGGGGKKIFGVLFPPPRSTTTTIKKTFGGSL